jgi:hypothetical protein
MAEIDEVLGGYLRERTPKDVPDFGDVTARARRRSRTRVAAAVAGTLAVVAVGLGVVVGIQPDRPASTIVAIPSLTSVKASQSPVRDSQHSGALPEDGVSKCVEAYTPQAVAHLAFAFDGTVTHIGPGTTDRLGFGRLDSPREGQPGLVAVTFTVNHWFHGGTSATVTADMTSPVTQGAQSPATKGGDRVGKSYGIGSRFLVSGGPRWGGPALQDAIVLGCGFTRYYDPQTASAWRQAVR